MIDKERLVRLTRKVIGFDSCNPPGNEYKLAQFIKKDMRSAGLTVKTHTFAPRRPNVIATLKGTWPRKKAAREAVLLTPHFDTVPFGSGWKYDPLGGTIRGGRIYGRGATDDKGNLACCMEVMRSLAEDGVRLKRDIIMAATVDEETGSHHGIIPLLEKRILNPKAALIVDSEDYKTIVAQKGLIHARVRISGQKAHGAYNWLGVNAIELAARAVGKLKAHKFKYKKHRFLHPPTVNIGTIAGGDKVNMVADSCEFSVDVRFLPGMKAQDVLRDIKRIIRGVTPDFKIEVDDIQHPYEIPPSHPFVRAYVRTARAMKIKAPVMGSEGATVITFFQKHKIAAFATGFGAHGIPHTTDEYAVIKDLYQGTRLLEKFLKEYDARQS